jgi:hypothetical protein
LSYSFFAVVDSGIKSSQRDVSKLIEGIANSAGELFAIYGSLSLAPVPKRPSQEFNAEGSIVQSAAQGVSNYGSAQTTELHTIANSPSHQKGFSLEIDPSDNSMVVAAKAEPIVVAKLSDEEKLLRRQIRSLGVRVYRVKVVF